MLKKGEHIEGVPMELQQLLDMDEKANAFFETLFNQANFFKKLIHNSIKARQTISLIRE